MENEYNSEPRKVRLPQVILAVAVFTAMAFVLGTCSKVISKVPDAAAGEEVFQKVGRQLQKGC